MSQENEKVDVDSPACGDYGTADSAEGTSSVELAVVPERHYEPRRFFQSIGRGRPCQMPRTRGVANGSIHVEDPVVQWQDNRALTGDNLLNSSSEPQLVADEPSANIREGVPNIQDEQVYAETEQNQQAVDVIDDRCCPHCQRPELSTNTASDSDEHMMLCNGTTKPKLNATPLNPYAKEWVPPVAAAGIQVTAGQSVVDKIHFFEQFKAPYRSMPDFSRPPPSIRRECRKNGGLSRFVRLANRVHITTYHKLEYFTSPFFFNSKDPQPYNHFEMLHNFTKPSKQEELKGSPHSYFSSTEPSPPFQFRKRSAESYEARKERLRRYFGFGSVDKKLFQWSIENMDMDTILQKFEDKENMERVSACNRMMSNQFLPSSPQNTTNSCQTHLQQSNRRNSDAVLGFSGNKRDNVKGLHDQKPEGRRRPNEPYVKMARNQRAGPFKQEACNSAAPPGLHTQYKQPRDHYQKNIPKKYGKYSEPYCSRSSLPDDSSSFVSSANTEARPSAEPKAQISSNIAFFEKIAKENSGKERRQTPHRLVNTYRRKFERLEREHKSRRFPNNDSNEIYKRPNRKMEYNHAENHPANMGIQSNSKYHQQSTITVEKLTEPVEYLRNISNAPSLLNQAVARGDLAFEQYKDVRIETQNVAGNINQKSKQEGANQVPNIEQFPTNVNLDSLLKNGQEPIRSSISINIQHQSTIFNIQKQMSSQLNFGGPVPVPTLSHDVATPLCYICTPLPMQMPFAHVFTVGDTRSIYPVWNNGCAGSYLPQIPASTDENYIQAPSMAMQTNQMGISQPTFVAPNIRGHSSTAFYTSSLTRFDSTCDQQDVMNGGVSNSSQSGRVQTVHYVHTSRAMIIPNEGNLVQRDGSCFPTVRNEINFNPVFKTFGDSALVPPELKSILPENENLSAVGLGGSETACQYNPNCQMDGGDTFVMQSWKLRVSELLEELNKNFLVAADNCLGGTRDNEDAEDDDSGRMEETSGQYNSPLETANKNNEDNRSSSSEISEFEPICFEEIESISNIDQPINIVYRRQEDADCYEDFLIFNELSQNSSDSSDSDKTLTILYTAKFLKNNEALPDSDSEHITFDDLMETSSSKSILTQVQSEEETTTSEELVVGAKRNLEVPIPGEQVNEDLPCTSSSSKSNKRETMDPFSSILKSETSRLVKGKFVGTNRVKWPSEQTKRKTCKSVLSALQTHSKRILKTKQKRNLLYKPNSGSMYKGSEGTNCFFNPKNIFLLNDKKFLPDQQGATCSQLSLSCFEIQLLNLSQADEDLQTNLKDSLVSLSSREHVQTLISHYFNMFQKELVTSIANSDLPARCEIIDEDIFHLLKELIAVSKPPSDSAELNDMNRRTVTVYEGLESNVEEVTVGDLPLIHFLLFNLCEEMELLGRQLMTNASCRPENPLLGPTIFENMLKRNLVAYFKVIVYRTLAEIMKDYREDESDPISEGDTDGHVSN